MIHFYARIATKFQCLASAKKTLEIVNRMNKRYEAYKRETDGSEMAKRGIVSPNLFSYKAILGAFSSLNEVSIEDLEKIEEILLTMKQYENLELDESMTELMRECLDKCNDNCKDSRVKMLNGLIASKKKLKFNRKYQ